MRATTHLRECAGFVEAKCFSPLGYDYFLCFHVVFAVQACDVGAGGQLDVI